jgi:hypothetical protein
MHERRREAGWAYLLLLIPAIAVLYPPLYSHLQPVLGGIPFFVWYQLLWTLLGALVIGIVYLIQRGSEEDREPDVRAEDEEQLTPP